VNDQPSLESNLVLAPYFFRGLSTPPLSSSYTTGSRKPKCPDLAPDLGPVCVISVRAEKCECVWGQNFFLQVSKVQRAEPAATPPLAAQYGAGLRWVARDLSLRVLEI